MIKLQLLLILCHVMIIELFLNFIHVSRVYNTFEFVYNTLASVNEQFEKRFPPDTSSLF